MGGCSELLYQWIYLYCGLSISWVGKLATVYSSSYVSVPIKCIYDLGAVWLGNVTGYPGVFQSNLHLYLLLIKTCTCIYRHWFSWAWVKGLQKPTGTPTHMGLCLQRWPMNLARAVQVSMDTAVQPCKDWKVIWLVLWDFRCFHRCFHGRLVIIWGLCLWGGVWHWSGHCVCHGMGWASSHHVCSYIGLHGQVNTANVAGGGRGISWGSEKRDEWEQAMSHGLFLWHTNWASHLLSPPLCSSCHTPWSSKPTSLWRG